MKKTLFFLSSILIVFLACKKEESSIPQPSDTSIAAAPPPPPQRLPLEMLPPPIANYINSLDVNLIRTPEAASQLYMNIPDSALMVPLPPGMRPFRNLVLQQRTDSTALYTFSMARPTVGGEMLLVRTYSGGDTIWVPLHILPKGKGK